MEIHILGQPDPNAPIDAEVLSQEFQAGLELFMDVPLSITHLACLSLAAQRAVFQPDCSHPVRAVLLQFLGWCSQHAEFGIETRKLLAAQAEEMRLRGMDSNGVQADGVGGPSVQTPGPGSTGGREGEEGP